MASALRPQALLGPVSRACPQRTAFSAASIAPVRRPVMGRGALIVVAAEKTETKKKLPSPEKRALISEERRMYNKSHKSLVATRIKKVLLKAESLMSNLPKTEDEVKDLEKLISAAYVEIDKAVSSGILHANTAARKKARCARQKKTVLISAGLYVPAADSPDYAKYLRLTQKKQAA